jgi:diguanylate cyclase (GGDEF)-like protein
VDLDPEAGDSLSFVNPDLAGAVAIAPDVWWVGAMREGLDFQSHVYLIDAGDQSILIDPGSALIVEDVIAKVDAVVGLANVAWLVCSNTNPDVVGALDRLVAAGLNPRAQIVTHYHDEVFLVHTATPLGFWRIEEHGWRLEVAGRSLRFESIPYVPEAGSFVTFDEASGVLFSSSLFGGLTPEGELVARSMDYYEAIRRYHQHFIAGREVLSHALSRVRPLDVRVIAPHHGQVVTGELVEGLMERLSHLETGLSTLAQTDPNVRFALSANRIMHRVIDALVHEQRFSDVVAFLDSLSRRTTGSTHLELWAGPRDAFLHFDASDDFAGRREDPPDDVVRVLRGGRSEDANTLILPIVTSDLSEIEGAAVIGFAGPVEVNEEVLSVVDQVIGLVGVGLEREVLRRATDMELAVWRRRAVQDTLTGLRNRASLADSARRMVIFDEQLVDPQMAALMVDIDYFKAINDTRGHLTGDRVLQHVAHAITDSVRPSDLIFRYGGEEFLVLLAHVDLEAARSAAERIRARVSVPFEGLSVSVSVGVATRERGEEHESLLGRADRALYRAKSLGRDRVEIATAARS